MIKREKFLVWHNTKISYSVSGSGPCILLVHGFGEDHRIWNHLISSFENNYRIIAPDLPGSGHSAMPSDIEITMESLAHALCFILDSEKIDKCLLFGHSMGGYISMAFASLFPDRLMGMGMIHSGAHADDEAKKEIRTKAIEFIKTYGSKAFLATATPGLFMNPTVHERDIEFLLDDATIPKESALIAYYQAIMQRPDRSKCLKQLPFPILWIIGRHDMAVPAALSLQQCHLARINDVHILKHSAHMGMLEEPEAFHRIFGSFLASPFYC